MNFFKKVIVIFFLLALMRLIPHPPNFTSSIALAFYIPMFFGSTLIPIVVFSYVFTDFYYGFHDTIFFTWGSLVVIGIFATWIKNNLTFRIFGSLTSAVIFFIISNFGVWISGLYGLDFTGLLKCYLLAIPFFVNTLVSTFLFTVIIEFGIYIYTSNKLRIRKLLKL